MIMRPGKLRQSRKATLKRRMRSELVQSKQLGPLKSNRKAGAQVSIRRVGAKAQSTRVAYELHSLGWKAFQDLALAVCSEIWGQTVQGFVEAHDGGRDGAFYGTWQAARGMTYKGTFAVQCKFTANPNHVLKISDLRDELAKARRLAKQGIARNYFVLTNARVTGTTEEKLRSSFQKLPKLKNCAIFGYDRICQIIRESARLRMMVPRVYGIGDLSQILDERSYSQAREIISALGDDLAKFVITEAYRSSAKALSEHGFVLLLGEPACGKSTIAAALAMAALDSWKCSTVKIRSADDFVKHWNPDEPTQFFWVDDAFGATQIDSVAASNWSKAFPHLQAAIRKGARVLFTSRDYVYRSAREYLKEGAFPLIKESQVVIRVENIEQADKDQILYNHVRLGTQPVHVRAELKPFLQQVSHDEGFGPEIARRLGGKIFTKRLDISVEGIADFVAHPKDFLLDVIRTLDAPSKSAIAVVFMRGGQAKSPIELTRAERRTIEALGGDRAKVVAAFGALKGSLLSLVIEDGAQVWRLKHPTIRDAFASLIADDAELLDIYLAGTPIGTMFREVACGRQQIEGVKVVVPSSRFDAVIKRMASDRVSAHRTDLHYFLAHRCDRAFLTKFIEANPNFASNLRPYPYVVYSSPVTVLCRLHSVGLLDEKTRRSVVKKMAELAISVPDAGFLHPRIRGLLRPAEMNRILRQVETKLIPRLEQEIENVAENYSRGDDVEEHFSSLKDTLRTLRGALIRRKAIIVRIDEALSDIDERAEELEDGNSDAQYGDSLAIESPEGNAGAQERSIFDDVDAP